MQIIVLANEIIKQEFQNKKINTGVGVSFAENFSELSNYNSADAFFLLNEEINIEDRNTFGEKPVFINSVINTLKESDLPRNFIRINGWPTFLNREIWEIATKKENIVKEVFEKMELKYIPVEDEPGLVAARIISMIINEAYFALGENVSSKDEIDLAMKLGTNYQYGPFEWGQKIGLKKVHSLLRKLSEKDNRYRVAPEMKNELTTTT